MWRSVNVEITFLDSFGTNALRLALGRLRAMGTRFFSATAFCGRLYVQGVPERGPWDASQLVYWTEEQIDLVFNPLTGDRKVRAFAELERALEDSRLGPPALKVWIAEGLEEEARRAWQEFSPPVHKGSFG